MEPLTAAQKYSGAKSEGGDDILDPMNDMPATKFSKEILRSVIGEDRANRILTSMSMSVIPNMKTNSMGGGMTDGIMKSMSSNDMGNMFKFKLDQLHKNLEKKTKQRGISQYLDDNEDSDNDVESFDDENDELAQMGDKSMMAEKDPSTLIDLELVNLLKFCNDLKNKHKDTDDYQEEVMMKSLELGKKTKDKTLILDMDETLIAAKFEGKEPKNFKRTFSFPFGGSQIHVRFRPFVEESLEKLSQMYELVVFTAGVKDYATPILDKMDPDGTIFKKRMFRDECIKVDQFFIKDLDVILDREKKDMIIVDNSILSFAFDLPNGVPINSFIGDEPDDRDLLYLVSFLDEAFYQPDVRTSCEESFKLQYLLSTITGDAAN